MMVQHGFNEDKNDPEVFDEQGRRALTPAQETSLMRRLVATLVDDREADRPRSVPVVQRMFE